MPNIPPSRRPTDRPGTPTPAPELVGGLDLDCRHFTNYTAVDLTWNAVSDTTLDQWVLLGYVVEGEDSRGNFYYTVLNRSPLPTSWDTSIMTDEGFPVGNVRALPMGASRRAGVS